MTTPAPSSKCIVIAPLLISLLGGGCATQRPDIYVPGTHERLEALSDAYVAIKKHYLNPITPGQLSASAIRGMEEFAVSKNSVLREPILISPGISANEEASLKAIGTSFGSLSQGSNLDPERLEEAAIKGMIESLDPHSAFMTPGIYREMQVATKDQFGGIGLQIGHKEDRLTVIAPIEGSPADKAGIKSGDFLTKVNDESIENLTLTEVVQKLRGPFGSKMSITLERKGVPELLSFELVRDHIKIESVQSRTIEGNIGYVRLKQFQEDTAKELFKALAMFRAQGVQAFILDLRNNPGGLLTSSVDVTELFVEPHLLIVSVMNWEGRKDEYFSRSRSFFPKTPLVVLVNQGSAAASEIVAGALQDYRRAKIVGVSTFGRGTVQTILPLKGGAWLRLTTGRIYTPSGRSFEPYALEPDIVIQDQDGLDASLASAVAVLKTELQKEIGGPLN